VVVVLAGMVLMDYLVLLTLVVVVVVVGTTQVDQVAVLVVQEL
jgi:hypothetical protein